MIDEAWVEVKDFPNYIVSNYGEVISLKTNRRLTPSANGSGYLKVGLCNGEGVTFHYIHQLVAKAFFTSFLDGMHVSHVNGDKTNNRITNLRLRGGKKATLQHSGRPPNASWGKRVRIIETGDVFRTARDCARFIGGDYSCVYACLRGDRNKHLGYSFEYYEENDG